ncbi:MAG: MBOAT family protein [Methylococcaceae bacterium]|nr:MAG: MBOAT family protein [Methylococcaceae bacterium]
MLFPTVEYALFFIVVLWFSWGCIEHPRLHKALLLVSSYVFYGVWDWHFLPLLFGLSTYAWLAARVIALGNAGNTAAGSAGVPPASRGRGHLGRTKGTLALPTLLLGIAGCLATLIYYKYLLFLGLALSNLSAWAGLSFTPELPTEFLPLGISFMVFHAISLLMDVYRGKLNQPGPLVDTLLYVAFFPQLIAGPILRASRFLPQLRHPPDPARIPVSRGFLWILVGLFKKVVIANALATGLVDEVFAAPALFSSLQALCAVYAYAVQIYCDFSGYTDIAIGCALLLGYRFPANFANPYTATSPQDFWHRWHISLSTWLRDYLYIPLGGSRGGPWRTRLNLLVAMLLGGLWHGAAWTFVAWGGWHGLLLVLHRIWSELAPVRDAVWRRSRCWRWISRLLCFHAICLGWILFRATDFGNAAAMVQRIAAGDGVLTGLNQPWLPALLVGFGLQFVPLRALARMELGLVRLPPLLRGCAIGVMLLLIEILGPVGVAPFIYFQF